MWYRVVCAGVAVLLSFSSLASDEGDNSLEKLQMPSDAVDIIEAAPLPSATEPEPVGERARKGPDPFAEERARVGQDPRETVRKQRKSPERGLVRVYDEPIAPMAGRVGIMSLIGTDLRHVHSSTFGGHQSEYKVAFNLSGFIQDELRKALLSQTPYQPVPVAATGLLKRSSDTWQETWDGKQFAPQFQREFDGIIKQNRLAMLIIISYSVMDDGQWIGGAKLSGSGLFTRSGFGGPKAAVFSTFQFYRLVGTPATLIEPVAAESDRSIGDLPGIKLPDDLEDLPARYLAPVYEPLRIIVRNKISGLISQPRKLGH